MAKTNPTNFTSEEEAAIQAKVQAEQEKARQAEIDAEAWNRIQDAQRGQPGYNYY